jgi:hypothetical protein
MVIKWLSIDLIIPIAPSDALLSGFVISNLQ